MSEPADYSIIIPAFNEQAWLTRTIHAAQQAMQHSTQPGELIVVDNNSSDDTPAIAAAAGARVIFEPINQISRARNAGARAAQGSKLIFLDADTLLDAELLREALHLLDNRLCIGGGALIDADGPASRSAQRALNGWNWLSKTTGLAAGCFIFCRADAFNAIGGFSERVYASEEIWLSRALKKRARRENSRFMIIQTPMIRTSLRKLDWYHSGQLGLYTLAIVLFPLGLISKRFCGFWYQKPVASKRRRSPRAGS